MYWEGCTSICLIVNQCICSYLQLYFTLGTFEALPVKHIPGRDYVKLGTIGFRLKSGRLVKLLKFTVL